MNENDKPLPEVHLTHSPSIGALAAALAKAQAITESAPKSHTAEVESKRTGQKYSYSYADLAGVWDAGRGPLTSNGLSVVQAPTITPSGLNMTTLLMHSSGEWCRGELRDFPVPDRTPQGVGTSITYARRYTFGAMTGIVSEEDDDGGNGGRPRSKSDSGAAPQSATGQVPTTLPNFGKAAGQPIQGAALKDLEFYAERIRKSVSNPEKANYKSKNEAMLKALESEIQRQSGPVAGVPKDFAPYQQAVALGVRHGWLEDNVKHWLKTKRGKSGSATVTAEDVEALRVALEPPETQGAPPPGDGDAPF